MAEQTRNLSWLRAISHPVRARILGELTASGPLRAADLARSLGLPANQLSFHLRQLAKYGLVEDAPEAARDRRDRAWRRVEPEIRVDLPELARQPGGRAAVEVFRQSHREWAHLLVDRALSADPSEPGVHRSVSEHSLRLTGDEAAVLQAELDEVVERWAERTRGERDDDRRTYLLYSMLQPYPEA